MVKLNRHYLKLQRNYLFAEIEQRIAIFQKKNPHVELYNLGIGDFTRPLPQTAVSALSAAVEEMRHEKTFRGYGPAEGYLFLREAIAKVDYEHLGISPEEIFISDGAQNDLAHIQEIFCTENRIAVANPTYPGYIDINVMAGRTKPQLKTGGYGGVIYLDCNEKNDFCPEPPNRAADLIYLCSPNNPTGTALTHDALKHWIDFAKEHSAVILFDGAYEAYVRSPEVPRSIYEIEGAKEVAIEIRSFSKNAGFTGLRCSYTVVPNALQVTENYQTQSLNAFWKRRQNTKFGGVSYPIQRAAEALYTTSGQEEIRAITQEHLDRASLIRNRLLKMGYTVFGGIDAPYVWVKAGKSSWDFFDELLEKSHLVSVPGVGFGSLGEGYIRLSAFANPSHIEEGLKRFELI